MADEADQCWDRAHREYDRLRGLGSRDPVEAGLMLNLADFECPHGSLPSDRVVACSCWSGGNGKAAGRG